MMKRLLILLLVITVSTRLTGQRIQPENYIFFLHNKFIEDKSLDDLHPQYGKAEYKEIVAKFRKGGFKVISEKRKTNTDIAVYAHKVVKQIDSLLHSGVKPSRITIVGTSKGGYIAQYVSHFSENPELNFVFIGSSFTNDVPAEEGEMKLYGHVLSIIEDSDGGRLSLAEQPRFKASNIKDFKEIKLNTKLKHGFLFKALDDWIVPTENWINERADR